MAGGGQNYVSVREMDIDSLISFKGGEGLPELDDIGAAWAIRTGRDYKFYQSIKTYPWQFGDQDAHVTEYIHFDSKSAMPGSKAQARIGYSRDIIMTDGEHVYIITVSTGYNDWVLKKDNLKKISLSLSND